MTEDITTMRTRHDAEIATLQSTCEHPVASRSNWMPYYYAPGHSDGHVKVCGHCGLVMERTNGSYVSGVISTYP